MAIGEPPVAADALEAGGQHVQQEAANELAGRESVMVLWRAS